MTSKKKLRSLLGGTLFMVLMLSVHPTTVSASAVGSSTVMDQSVETEDQQSGIQSETQTQASQDSVAAVRASQNGWVKAGDGGWYFYENGQLKTGWLYRNGNWYWLDPDRNGRMAENSWFTYDNNFYYAKGDGAIYKNGFQEVDGNLYYFQSWGGIQKNVYLSISGKMYYVQENGIVARGIVRTMNGHGDLCAFDDTTGAQITQKGWLKKGTSYYWVREDGVLQTGWLLYDDNWYWFDDNGVMMASGWKEINNNLYYFRHVGDISEAKAIKAVFGDAAYKLNISSTKSMTGHLLGAAGAVEAMACVLSVKNDIVPPTINHEEGDDDPELDYNLNFTFNKAQKREVRAALSNTFGFGGHNCCVVFKKYAE